MADSEDSHKKTKPTENESLNDLSENVEVKPKERRKITKLDVDHLLSSKDGLNSAVLLFKKIKYIKETDPLRKLTEILNIYREWATYCFPKYDQDDFFFIIKKFRKDKRIQSFLNKLN